jgi:Icc-related predicted phosphoesterase
MSNLQLAAVGDLHCTAGAQGKLQAILNAVLGKADVLLLCGDLTDNGTADEARILATELARTGSIPKLGVLGNHDYECGHEADVKQILTDAGVFMMDGDATVIQDVGFVGIKGFAGGFGRRMLEPWGEGPIKQFVQEAVNESLKLESALAKLRVPSRIVLMHYAPIEATVTGEPAEIFPFLGCSRLEEPLNRHGVTAVFHGHAHYGALEGTTKEGVPVYNVAAPLLRRVSPDAPAVRFLAVARNDSPRDGHDAGGTEAPGATATATAALST